MDLPFAYIDPASGSLVIQALIAGLIAIPFFFRNKISKFIRTVRGDSSVSSEAAPGQDDSGHRD